MCKSATATLRLEIVGYRLPPEMHLQCVSRLSTRANGKCPFNPDASYSAASVNVTHAERCFQLQCRKRWFGLKSPRYGSII